MFSRTVAQRNGLSLSDLQTNHAQNDEHSNSPNAIIIYKDELLYRVICYWYNTRSSGRIMYVSSCSHT